MLACADEARKSWKSKYGQECLMHKTLNPDQKNFVRMMTNEFLGKTASPLNYENESHTDVYSYDDNKKQIVAFRCLMEKLLYTVELQINNAPGNYNPITIVDAIIKEFNTNIPENQRQCK